MPTFEFNNNKHHEHNEPAQVQGVMDECHDHRRLREECIITFKVYDACRHPNCCLLHHMGVRKSNRPFIIYKIIIYIKGIVFLAIHYVVDNG